METKNDEMEIDLLEMVMLLLHYWWIILLVAIATAAMGFGFSKFVLPETFTSTTEIYILNNNDNNSGAISYSDLQIGSVLTNDYAHLITTRDVLEQVIGDLELEDTYESLSGRVTVSTPKDTRIVAIAVEDTDPQMAQMIANSVRETASAHIKSVMALDAVNVASMANYPDRKSGPSVKKWTAVAGAVGALFVIAIIVIRFLLDDTIKTSEDVEKYLELSTLGMIPEIESEDSKKGNKKKESKSDKKASEDKMVDLDEDTEKNAAKEGK